jgi:UDP-glucose 4-epimerase
VTLRVVVTGGAGFIGANVCRALAAMPDVERVVALDDLSTGSSANLAAVDTRVELVVGSILDPTLVADVVAGVDAIVHLAARPSVPRSIADPMASHQVNATGTMVVLEAARAARVGQFVVASSSSVYGSNPTLPKSESLATVPMSPYAASKLATEGYAVAYGHSFGLGVLAFRFFNVFGPLQAAGHAYAAVIPAFVDAALGGRPLTVHGDGQQSRDFTYVESVTAVICAAVAGRVSSPKPVNLAFGSRLTLLDVIARLEHIVGHRLEVEFTDPRPGDVRHSQADSSLLRELFPALEPVPFDTGLERTVAWFRAMRSP